MRDLAGAVLCAIALLGAAAALRAQDPAARGQQASPPTFRTAIDVVRVDVSVIGADDAAVADLQPSDFEVEEDGVRQVVQTLQFVRLDGTRTTDTDESLVIRSAEHAALEAAREDVRVFAIFLDDYHVEKAPLLTNVTRRALKRLVEQFGPNDLVAVMDPLTPLSHLRFTRSRDELLRRIGDFEGRKGVVFPVRSALEEGQLAGPNLWEIRGGVTLSALGSLVTHLGGLREGRKSVLFVSQGPPLGRLGAPNHSRLEEVVQAANRGNVTIHVFDPRPLGSAPLGGADSLFRLYGETGGRAIVNRNAPGDRLGQIIQDASAYYLLGYTPARDLADGRFHRIEVKVKRRRVRVLARQGYWAPTSRELAPDLAPAPSEPGLVEALTDLVAPREGRVADVWFGATRGSAGTTRLTVSWEPAGRSAGAAPARLVVEPVRERAHVDPAERRTISRVGAAEGPTVASFDVTPQAELALRVTVEAADGAVLDQWRQRLHPPSLAGQPVALSTPRFLRTQSAFEARAMAHGAEPAPAASRRFRRTDRVVVDVDCYAQGAATVTAQLLNDRGERLAALDPPAMAGRRARFTLPLSSVAPGTYVLRLEARTGGGDAYQRSAFRVVP